MDILVIGTGMYSTGRGTDSYGTILPSIIESIRAGNSIENVFFFGKNPKNTKEAEKKCAEISAVTNICVNFTVYPREKNNINLEDFMANLKNPTCAIIAVPDHLHYDMAKLCLETNLHTLVVKPLTPHYKDSKELADIAKKNNLFGMVEFHKRWDKANIMMKNYIENGSLGDILYCVVEYSQRKSIPTQNFIEWADKSNILQYLGIHYIDLLYFLTNARPIRVMSIGQKNWLIKNNINTWDSIQCTIEWVSNNDYKFTQTILTNWIDPENTSAMSDQKIKIIGTRGRFESDQKNRGQYFVSDDQKITQPNPYFCHEYHDDRSKFWSGYGIDSVTSFLKDVDKLFNNSINLDELEKTRPTFKQSLIITAIIDAANKSIQNDSSWIDIKINS